MLVGRNRLGISQRLSGPDQHPTPVRHATVVASLIALFGYGLRRNLTSLWLSVSATMAFVPRSATHVREDKCRASSPGVSVSPIVANTFSTLKQPQASLTAIEHDFKTLRIFGEDFPRECINDGVALWQMNHALT